MIQAMDSPEATVTSLWETLSSSPWWKTILITIILIALFLLFAPCICNCVTGFVSNHLKAFKLQMVVQAPTSATASSNYYLGPLDQRPSIWGLGEYAASTAGSSYVKKMMPLSLGNIILLKEKGAMREWIPRQVNKKFRVPKERGVWDFWGRDRSLEFSRRRKGQTFFFF